MNNLLDKSIELNLLYTKRMVMDASKLEVYEQANPKLNIDKGNFLTPD